MRRQQKNLPLLWSSQNISTFVLFIPYFRLLVFGILVTLVAWFFFSFFRLAHLALQNVNKDYIIFSYFRNFVAKSDQKPKTKNGMNETFICRSMYIRNLKSRQHMYRRHLPLQIFELIVMSETAMMIKRLSSFKLIMYDIQVFPSTWPPPENSQCSEYILLSWWYYLSDCDTPIVF